MQSALSEYIHNTLYYITLRNMFKTIKAEKPSGSLCQMNLVLCHRCKNHW